MERSSIPASRRHGLLRKWASATLLGLSVTVGSGLFTPQAIRADTDSDMDGRLSGYGKKKVDIDKSSSAGTVLIFLGLTIVACVPLFKAAKRN